MTHRPGLWSRLRSFLSELRRRRVYRVGVVYLVVAVGTSQAAEAVFPALRLPDWALTLVVVLLLLGFPVALVLAWALEVTPEGVKRTEGAGDDVEPVDDSRRVGATGSPEAGEASPEGAPAPGSGAGVRIFAVGLLLAAVGAGSYAYWGFDTGSSGPGERSIAVLPFDNLSGEVENEYFSDGITEDILTNLSKIGELRVISRTSAMRYKDSEKTLPEIGRELGVAYVLEGSVRRADDRIRVTAQLIRTRDDDHVWADSYDRRLEDIFAIQSEIAQRIAGVLEARLTPEVRQRIESAPTSDMAAYEHYLKGREAFFRLGESDLTRAVGHYRRAVERDADFALAYAGMADAFAGMEGYHGLGERWLDSALVAGNWAIALDPDVAEAYAAQAHAYWIQGRTGLAERLSRRALELKPNYPLALWMLSFIHHERGRIAEAVEAGRRAQALEPAAAWYAATLGNAWAEADPERAERWWWRALELQPGFDWPNQRLAWHYIEQGEFAEAERQVREARSFDADALPWLERTLALYRGELETARRLHEAALDSPREEWGTSLRLAYIHQQQEDSAKAEELLRWTPEWAERLRRRQGPGTEYVLARIAAVDGSADRAFRHLRAAVGAGFRDHWEMRANPLLADLRSDPRFQEILAEVRRALEAERERIPASPRSPTSGP